MSSSLEFDIFTEEEAPRRRRRGSIAVLVALFLVTALLAGAVFVVRPLLDRVDLGGPEDYPGPGQGEVLVQVRSGQSLTQIGRTLKGENVVASVEAFTEAASETQGAESVQPGFYTLKEEMSARDAVAALLDPGSKMLTRVTLPEGLRVDETIAALAKGTKISPKKYRAALKNARKLGLPPYAEGQPEGFLFPATYEVPPNATPAQVLKQLFRRFDRAAAKAEVKRARLSPYETVIVASIVEGEARRPADFPKVARVIYNRLERGMRLEMDSTINYALAADKELVTHEDLRVQSPYNTYTNDGLPPGPINSPGERALRAAVQPATGEWVFFVTVNPKSGETKFAETFAEHQQLRAELKKNQRDG